MKKFWPGQDAVDCPHCVVENGDTVLVHICIL